MKKVLKNSVQLMIDKEMIFARLNNTIVSLGQETTESLDFLNKISKSFEVSTLSAEELIVFEKLNNKDFFRDEKSENLKINDFELEKNSRTLDYFERKYINSPNLDKFKLLAALKQKNVLLVGVGGLGSWVLYNLLCIGIGKITILDGDVVETSNLNRSIMYREKDIGKYKVEAAKENAYQFSSASKIKTVNQNLRGKDKILEELRKEKYDLVISCADKPYWKIQNWLQDACESEKVPFLVGVGGKIGPLYIPNQTSCRKCFLISKGIDIKEFEVKIEKLSKLPPSRQGVYVPFVTLNASIIAYEAITFLINKKECNSINNILVNKSPYEFEKISVSKQKQCTCF
jgi:molybdopterin-synthase adenylyltransferase